MPLNGPGKIMFELALGKLAERQNLIQNKLISDPHDLYRFLATLGVEVMNLLFASDNVVWASWRYNAEEQVPRLNHTNVVIAAFLACVGRMLL